MANKTIGGLTTSSTPPVPGTTLIEVENQTGPATEKCSKDAFLSPESPIAPTLLNSWVNLGSTFAVAGYWKDANGRVHLAGVVKNGGVTSVIFTLPVGYRPADGKDHIFACQASKSPGAIADHVTGEVYVNSNGDVAPNFAATYNYYLSLDGISFQA